jgi:murein L,D-transpeptidase YafK
MSGLFLRAAVLAASTVVLAACTDQTSNYPARAYAPIPGETLALMKSKDTDRNAPVLVRAYKKESEIEVWKQASNGEYVHLKTYPVCRWSGQLGPKKKEGDRQVPEGFYTVGAQQMNPNSAYWLAFNVGYPNTLDRALGRSGGDIMTHGICSSRGCFAMTNEQIEEIYAVMREAFNGGQKAVQFQSYPFRMTAENMAKFRHDPNIAFWKNLKEGSDNFEVTKRPVEVAYCGSKYVFNAAAGGPMEPTAPCPALKPSDPQVASAVAEKAKADDVKVAELIQKGTPAIRVQYADGSQHPSFRSNAALAYAGGSKDDNYALLRAGSTKVATLGDVSRPEAIDAAEEVVVDETGKPKAALVQVAAKPEPAKPASAPPSVRVAAASPAVPTPEVAAAPAAAIPAGESSGGTMAKLTSFFSPSSPAQTGSITPAPAPSQSAVPAVAAKTDGKPFYKRWLGWGSDDAAASEATPAAAPVPAKVPLPPRREAAAEKPQKQSAITPRAKLAQATDAAAAN